MTEPSIIAVITGGVAGLGIGAAYFALLYLAVRMHADAAPFRKVGPLHLARGLLALGGFWALVQLGAWPLLAGLAGFLIARLFAVRLQQGA